MKYNLNDYIEDLLVKPEGKCFRCGQHAPHALAIGVDLVGFGAEHSRSYQ
jgi:ribosomal protein L37E